MPPMVTKWSRRAFLTSQTASTSPLHDFPWPYVLTRVGSPFNTAGMGRDVWGTVVPWEREPLTVNNSVVGLGGPQRLTLL